MITSTWILGAGFQFRVAVPYDLVKEVHLVRIVARVVSAVKEKTLFTTPGLAASQATF